MGEYTSPNQTSEKYAFLRSPSLIFCFSFLVLLRSCDCMLFFTELLVSKWGRVLFYIHVVSCPLGRHDHLLESRHDILGFSIRCRPTWRGLVTRSWRMTFHRQVWLFTKCNMTSSHDNDSFILLWLDDKILKGSQWEPWLKNKISCSWNPRCKHYNNFIFLLYISLHKSIITCHYEDWT